MRWNQTSGSLGETEWVPQGMMEVLNGIRKVRGVSQRGSQIEGSGVISAYRLCRLQLISSTFLTGPDIGQVFGKSHGDRSLRGSTYQPG